MIPIMTYCQRYTNLSNLRYLTLPLTNTCTLSMTTQTIVRSVTAPGKLSPMHILNNTGNVTVCNPFLNCELESATKAHYT